MAEYTYNVSEITEKVNIVSDFKQMLEGDTITLTGDIPGQVNITEKGNDIIINAYGTQQGNYQKVVTTVTEETAGKYKGKYKCVVNTYNATYDADGNVNGFLVNPASTKTTYLKNETESSTTYQLLDSKKKLVTTYTSEEFNYGIKNFNRTIVDEKKILAAFTYKNGTPDSYAVNLISDVWGDINILETPIMAVKSGKTYKGNWMQEMAISTANNEIFSLGTNHDIIAYNLMQKQGNDTVNLLKGEDLQILSFLDDGVTRSYSAKGNDVIMSMNKESYFSGEDYIKYEKQITKNNVGYRVVDKIYVWDNGEYILSEYCEYDLLKAEFVAIQKSMKQTEGVDIFEGTNTFYVKDYNTDNPIWYEAITPLGTVTFKNYLKLAEDGVHIGDQSLKEILEATEGVGIINRSGETKKQTINGTFLSESIIGSGNGDVIKGGAGNDTIEGGQGKDQLYGVDGNNTFVFNTGDGVDTVFSGKGEDALKFTNKTNGAALATLDYKVIGKDLQIFYTKNDYVIVKNYYDPKTVSSIKKIEAENGDSLSLEHTAPPANGAIRYTVSTLNTPLAIGNHNSEVTFTDDFGNNVITSNGKTYTDKLIFSDYSFRYDLTSYLDYDMENPNNLAITLIDGEWNSKSVIYSNFFTGNTHNLTVQDKHTSYNVLESSTPVNFNWFYGKEKNINHIAFLQGEYSNNKANKVVSNGGYNFIYTDEGINLNYTYKGGVDLIKTRSDESDDIYNIDVFNDKTDIILSDSGGNDTINIKSKSDNLMLYFDIWKVGNNEYRADRDDLLIVYKDSLSAEKISDIYEETYAESDDGEHSGVIELDTDGLSQEGYFGVEKYTTTDYKNGLDMAKWVSIIKSNVVEWVTAHGIEIGEFETVMDNVSPEDLNSLIACYNVSYNQAMAQPLA